MTRLGIVNLFQVCPYWSTAVRFRRFKFLNGGCFINVGVNDSPDEDLLSSHFANESGGRRHRASGPNFYAPFVTGWRRERGYVVLSS